jgi:hypothetical protein
MIRYRIAIVALLVLGGVLAACEGDATLVPPTTAGASQTSAGATTVATETTVAATTTSAASKTPSTPATTQETTTTTKSETATTQTTVAQAQVDLDTTLPAAFETIILAAGFLPDPYVSQGVSGGAFDAGQVGCLGFVAEPPDYELNWSGSGGGLRIYFESINNGDTTLVINGPDGMWYCADDSFGTIHPTIDFTSAPSGVYDIWVGSYYFGDNHNGALFITEGASQPTTVTTAPPSGLQLRPDRTAPYGEIVLSPGFTPDPLIIEMTSGGEVDVSYVGCAGYAATRPDFEVTYTGTNSLLRFYFIPDDASDTTLIINAPDGSWFCGDDSYGTFDPTIDFAPAQPGIYDVWIGVYDIGDNAPGNLFITEIDGFHP